LRGGRKIKRDTEQQTAAAISSCGHKPATRTLPTLRDSHGGLLFVYHRFIRPPRYDGLFFLFGKYARFGYFTFSQSGDKGIKSCSMDWVELV